MSNRTTPKTEPWQKAARDIAAGRCDEHLVEIAQALQKRIIDGNVVTQWRLRLDGLDVGESDLTLDEWERWTDLAGQGSWLTLKPLQSARAARTLVQVLIETRLGASPEEAAGRALSYEGGAILASFTEEQVVDPFDRPSA